MSADIVHLAEVGELDPKPTLAGPWRFIRFARIPAGDELALELEHTEYLVFVVDGRGSARVGGKEVPLRRGSSLTLMAGATARITGGDGGVEVFVVAASTER
jgi:mannose-6-phosphate isomerase-like protein (cupin superfamily)